MVVLFWLDLWEILFLPTPGFELGTSGSLVLNYTTEPQWFLVFTSDNFRYWSLVQRDWWWYCSDWTHERFSFFQTSIWTGDLWISSPELYHWATVTSVFHLLKFQALNSCAEGLVVVLFWLDLWEIFIFAHTRVWTGDLWISSPALYHCATATSGSFTSWDWWWYCSDFTCERFSFCPHQGLNWGPLDL